MTAPTISTDRVASLRAIFLYLAGNCEDLTRKDLEDAATALTRLLALEALAAAVGEAPTQSALKYAIAVITGMVPAQATATQMMAVQTHLDALKALAVLDEKGL